MSGNSATSKLKGPHVEQSNRWQPPSHGGNTGSNSSWNEFFQKVGTEYLRIPAPLIVARLIQCNAPSRTAASIWRVAAVLSHPSARMTCGMAATVGIHFPMYGIAPRLALCEKRGAAEARCGSRSYRELAYPPLVHFRCKSKLC